MYVYLQLEPLLFTVGFYTPNGVWVSETDHGSKEEAADRVHYLNGGKLETSPTTIELASIMIAQGIVQRDRQYDPETTNGVEAISTISVYLAKAVLEEANK